MGLVGFATRRLRSPVKPLVLVQQVPTQFGKAPVADERRMSALAIGFELAAFGTCAVATPTIGPYRGGLGCVTLAGA